MKNNVECRIARQYLCQTAMFMCGLAMLALTTIDGNYQAYLLFVWIYGEIMNYLHRFEIFLTISKYLRVQEFFLADIIIR